MSNELFEAHDEIDAARDAAHILMEAAHEDALRRKPADHEPRKYPDRPVGNADMLHHDIETGHVLGG